MKKLTIAIVIMMIVSSCNVSTPSKQTLFDSYDGITLVSSKTVNNTVKITVKINQTVSDNDIINISKDLVINQSRVEILFKYDINAEFAYKTFYNAKSTMRITKKDGYIENACIHQDLF